MAREFYVADDGSIHSHPMNVANSSRSLTNPSDTAIRTHTRAEHRSTSQVSNTRIVWFWIISMIFSVLVALGVVYGVKQYFGTEVFGGESELLETIWPYIVFIGALAGSILYGIFCAKKLNYNLWSYIISVLSSVGGIIAAGIAVAIIYVVICLILCVLAIGLVIAIIWFIIEGA